MMKFACEVTVQSKGSPLELFIVELRSGGFAGRGCGEYRGDIGAAFKKAFDEITAKAAESQLGGT